MAKRSRKGGIEGFVRSPWFYTASSVAGGLAIWVVATAAFAALTGRQITLAQRRAQGLR